MLPRRFLALVLPRFATERVLRREPWLAAAPLVVSAEAAGTRRIAALSQAAEAAGLAAGQPLAEARALCPDLIGRPADPVADAALLAALARWAGQFSPRVASEPPDALVLDIAGCAHLFGGETGLAERLAAGCAEFGLTACIGIADTPGAARVLARDRQAQGTPPAGNAIAQEARATRSRAARRRPVTDAAAAPPACRVAPPGQTLASLSPLPLAALALPEETAAALARLGLRRIGDLAALPRAALARRFGPDLTARLDRLFGRLPDTIAPDPPALHFATRLHLPEPVSGLDAILAGTDRLLPPLLARLAGRQRGVRRLRLELGLAGGAGWQRVEIGLARPLAEAPALRDLLRLKLERLVLDEDVETLRLHAHVTEPLPPRQPAAPAAGAGLPRSGLEDLVSRLGVRLGAEAVTRLHPAESHLPEKTAQPVAAAWVGPAPAPWPAPPASRPAILFAPEPVAPAADGQPPARFRWRRRLHRLCGATGPERIAPEWWLDDPAWRSGVRDYWRVETEEGARLWLFLARGGLLPGGWFCHGLFA